MGQRVSLFFLRRRGKVVIVDRNESLGRETEDEIKSLGFDAYFVKADLENLKEVGQIVPQTIARYGRVDILFGNAGINILKRTEDTTEADFEKLINTNLRGHFFLTKSAIPPMRSAGGGVVLFTSSTSGVSGEEDQVVYSATKGGIIAIVTAMAKDLGHYGIRVNCILPGSVDTPMLQEWFRTRPGSKGCVGGSGRQSYHQTVRQA